MSENQPTHADLSNDSGILDFDQLDTLAVLGFDDYQDLINDVIQSVPAHLERIQTAIRSGNSKQVGARAHELRGMLLSFGCAAMTRRLDSLEQHPVVDPDLASSLHSELTALWQKSIDSIRQWEKSVPEFTA